MLVKGKGSLDLVSSHEDKRNAVRETHSLVSEFYEEIHRFQFIGQIRTKDLQSLGHVEPSGPFRGEGITGSSTQKREEFIQDKVAGK